MSDENKEIGITEDFLEKHRSNTRKYMHLLSNTKEKPQSSQDIINRIESKFGVQIRRSSSQDVPLEYIKPTSDEKSLQEFIQQVRAKYLPAPESQPLLNPSISTPLIDLSSSVHTRIKDPIVPNMANLLDLPIFPEKPKEKENLIVNERKSYKNNAENNGDNLDSELLLSDLVSEPVVSHSSPINKPPRTKHVEEISHELPEREENNKSFNENSMSMSFRRIHAEQIITTAISEVISSRLRIQKKVAVSPRANKVFSFEKYLNSGKAKFAPMVKTVNIELLYREDEVLKRFLIRKNEILKELESLEYERQGILRTMGINREDYP